MKLAKASKNSMHLLSSTELIQELGVASPVHKPWISNTSVTQYEHKAAILAAKC